MAVSYDGGREPQPRRIADVLPAQGGGFDVRQASVRRQPIGRLEQEYLRQRAGTQGQGQALAAQGISPAPIRQSSFTYTRVPPLQTLDDFADLTDQPLRWLGMAWNVSRSTLQWLAWRSRVRLKIIGAAAVTLTSLAAVRVRTFSSGIIPKKYSVAQGWHIELNKKTKQLAWATPPALVLIIAAAILLSLGGSAPTKHPAASGAQHSQATASKTTSNPAQLGGKGSGSAGNASSSPSASVSAQPLQGGGSGGATGTTGGGGGSATGSGGFGGGSASTPTYSGGYGGGTSSGSGTTAPPPSSSSGSSGSGSSPSLLPTTTVTVPPQNVTVGGKPLVSTGGTSLTLDP